MDFTIEDPSVEQPPIPRLPRPNSTRTFAMYWMRFRKRFWRSMQQDTSCWVNVAAEQMFGYSRQEFLTLNVDALVPTAHRNIHARHRLGYAHQPKRRPMGSGLELEAQRRDGFLFPVEISLSPNHSAETLTVIVLVRDITDRKQAERALRKSEAKFRTLAHLVPQFVWMCTPDGLNVYFNQRWVDYTGLTLEESYGKGWNTPFHPDDKQPAWDAWNRAVATGVPYRVESRLRAADGSYRWFLMLGLPLEKQVRGILQRGLEHAPTLKN